MYPVHPGNAATNGTCPLEPGTSNADSWYANGPFRKTVVEELGWPVMAVLKQERYEAHQEALVLTGGQKPTQVVERDRRQV
jgi:hypothetical protein